MSPSRGSVLLFPLRGRWRRVSEPTEPSVLSLRGRWRRVFEPTDGCASRTPNPSGLLQAPPWPRGLGQPPLGGHEGGGGAGVSSSRGSVLLLPLRGRWRRVFEPTEPSSPSPKGKVAASLRADGWVCFPHTKPVGSSSSTPLASWTRPAPLRGARRWRRCRRVFEPRECLLLPLRGRWRRVFEPTDGCARPRPDPFRSPGKHPPGLVDSASPP